VQTFLAARSLPKPRGHFLIFGIPKTWKLPWEFEFATQDNSEGVPACGLQGLRKRLSRLAGLTPVPWEFGFGTQETNPMVFSPVDCQASGKDCQDWRA